MVSSLVFIFLLSLSSSNAVNYCCEGVIYSQPTPSRVSSVSRQLCDISSRAKCITNIVSLGTSYDCASESYECDSPDCTSCTTADSCNCPNNVNKDQPEFTRMVGEMRNIMFPVMGCIFGCMWVLVGFFIPKLPHLLVLCGVAMIDIVFGLFLIFLPSTVYLGLYFMLLGSFTILVVRNAQVVHGMILIGCGAFLGFLLIAGLTFISFNTTGSGPFIEILLAQVNNCGTQLNIVNFDYSYFNLPTRCENWALFVIFSLFLLFLVQPFAIFMVYYGTQRLGKQEGYEAVK